MHYYNIHNFLFGLKLEGKNLEGYEIEYLTKIKEIKKVKIKDIEITSNNIAFSLITTDGEKLVLPFYRIKKVFNSTGDTVFINEV